MKRLLTALLVAAIAAGMFAPDVAAAFVLLDDDAGSESDGSESDGSSPDNEDGDDRQLPGDFDSETQGRTITSSATNSVDGGGVFVSDTLAERGHAELEAQAPVKPPCLVEIPPVVRTDPDTGGVISSPAVCEVSLSCAGERIDDLLLGYVSGSDPGAYAEHVGEVAATIALDSTNIDSPLTTHESVNEFLLERGLGEQPEDDALAVFYYCRRSDTGEMIHWAPVSIPEYPGFDFLPSFGWDTTIEAEYDLDTVRADLFDELQAKLDLWEPGPQAIPPFEKARGIVNFPSWFWLEDPLEQVAVAAESDVGTILIEMRAELERVDWHFGEDLVISCAADEMKAFVIYVDHPFDDRPECSNIFTRVAQYDVSVSIHYNVQERISVRPSSELPYTFATWTAHPESPVELAVDVGPFNIGEILSVNIPLDATAAEIAALNYGE